MSHETFMKRCIELAKQGFGKVAPNPMVGCVVVHNGIVIGEGYHQKLGDAHAEVNAINSVHHRTLLQDAALYTNLEPCLHFGRTPPCTNLIIENKIKQVIIGTTDTNPLVKGKGIEKLINAGVDVKVGTLEKECRELNKRFFIFHEKKRPYIILKWAQTLNNFIAETGSDKTKTTKYVGSDESLKVVHQWRNEEAAIMVGTTTVLADNPQLTVRHILGKNPIRITLDKHLKISSDFHLLDKSVRTIIFTCETKTSETNLEYVQIDFDNNMVGQVLHELHQRNIQSVIIEGGSKLLNSFIENNLWDEARVFVSEKKFEKGVEAPLLSTKPLHNEKIGNDILFFYNNPNAA